MEAEKQVQNLPLEDVLPNRFQPRIKFSEESIEELANSIREHGVIQPIVVRRIGDKYEIIAGERRYKASQLAGKDTIPAIITNLDDNDSAEIALLENIQRENLTPIEEAISYKKILDMGYTQEALAKKIGNKQSTIANKVRLLNLTDEVQEALLENKISERHARSLLRVTDPTLQVLMLGQIIKGRYTVRKTDEEIEKLLKGELNMSDNNEMKTIIPTSKIYEEEPQQVVIPKIEEVTPVVAPEIKPVVEVAPVPVEIEEKVEVPKIEQKIENKDPYDTKFLEKETFVNMPMHNIPTERPYGENSEFRDGKYFNIATPNVQPTSNDTTFDDIFKNDIELKNSNIPVEKVDEEIKPTMPMFDFSNSTPLDNIETVSFGSDVPIAGQTTITPLTELPDVEDLAAITENIPTLEEMQLNLSDHMPVMENNNLEVNPTVEPSENPVVAEASPVVEELTPVNPVVGNTAPEIPTTPINETPVMEVTEPTNVAVSNDLSSISQEIPTIAPVTSAIPSTVEELNTLESTPIMEEPTIQSLTELPDVEDLAAVTENIPTLEEMQLNLNDHMPVMENNNLEVNPIVETNETPVLTEASPVVEELTPVNPVVGNIAPENPTTPVIETPVMEVTEPTNVAVSNDLSNISQEIPTYNIPTFDPDNGTTMTTVSEDVTPLVNNVAPVVEETSVVEEAPTIKLPFDGDTLNNLKNEFVNMLKAKGFNVNVDDMDFADSYKLIFTIEK